MNSPFEDFFQSVTLKISLIIILAEVSVLTVIGIVYVQRFSIQIEDRLHSQVALPGILMRDGLLGYEAAGNRNTMESLVGENLLDGFVASSNGIIFYSLNPANIGIKVNELDQFDLATYFTSELKDNLILTSPNRKTLVSITPLWRDDHETLLGFLYIEVETTQAHGERQRIIFLFALGSLGCVFLTSFIILFSFRLLISQRISRLSQVVQGVEAGDFSVRVGSISTMDEIGHLQYGVNSMIVQLESFVNTLEQRVTHRTQDLELARQEAETARLEAEKATNVSSQFLANMSHELRTPLNVIISLSQIITRDPNLSSQQRERLNIIQQSGDHLLQLINDVLEISKFKAGHIHLNPEAFDLHNMLLEIEQMFRVRAEQKNLALILNRDRDLPHYIKADERRLRQVLMNLIGNAIKFTEEGAVKVYTRMVGSQQLAFTVQDTGHGIPLEEIDNIFDVFHQAKNGQQLGEGTGLGLAISRQLVQAMQGNISVESVLGSGATFTFDIEVEIVQSISSPQIELDVIGVLPGYSNHKILIADDRWETQIMLMELLQPLGFQINKATNGKDAIDLYKTWQPDLIFLDLWMPKKNGLEVAREIQGSANGKIPKIIIITAQTLNKDQQLEIENLCDGFIQKPFRNNEIHKILKKHLNVQFQYAKPHQTMQNHTALETILGRHSLDNLPSEWRAKLHHIAMTAKSEELLAHISQIETDYPQIAQALRLLVKRFRFDVIMLASESKG